ncbi:MAG: type IV pilus assembly protein PilM [Brevundimonas sp.]
MATSSVIGLDIGSTSLRAAELEFGSAGPRGKNPPTLVRFGQVPLPLGAVRDGEVAQPETVSIALRQMWAQAKFESRDVIIGVGNQRVMVRELELPWLPQPQIKASLPFQVAESLPMSADDALLDFFTTSEGNGPNGRTVNGVLVAAQRDTVTANVLAVEGAGLRPVMVDLNAFALVRSLVRGNLARSTAAIVDIGATITTVVITQQGVPRLVRTLPIGGQSVTAAVASAAGMTVLDAEALKREIGVGFSVPADRATAAESINTVVRNLIESVRNTFVYYTSTNAGTAIDVVVLSGGGAHLAGLGQYLSSASRLPVTLAEPLGAVRLGKNTRRESLPDLESVMSVPVGLAYGVAA